MIVKIKNLGFVNSNEVAAAKIYVEPFVLLNKQGLTHLIFILNSGAEINFTFANYEVALEALNIYYKNVSY